VRQPAQATDVSRSPDDCVVLMTYADDISLAVRLM